MNRDAKNIIVIICFITILTGMMAVNIIKADANFSYSERRKLAGFPQFSSKKLFSGDLFDDFEKYFLDQFIFRDGFRSIKAIGSYYLFKKLDNNDVYIADGSISKILYPLNEKSTANAAKKLNEIYEKYLQGMKVYYSVIPDKNYFLASKNGYPEIDYAKMIGILDQNIRNMRYIDLFDSLSIDDYYKTDIHWSQDRIITAANRLLEAMGSEVMIDKNQFIEKDLYPFYGSYSGQLALRTAPDKLVYLTNEMLEKAVVYDHETKTVTTVYVPEKFTGTDPYDVFLSGAKALLEITNPENPDGRELILFRDSFGSSIAPLLLAGYSKITLVDLRYISTDVLGKYIKFSDNQDVLFLYNTMIINNSYMLK